jgi:hypothetical protein
MPDFCRGFLAYQLPIFDSRKKAGWGCLDLAGVSPQGLPQVWEIKKGKSTNSPFHLAMQMVAYGLAIRHLWNRGEFAAEWRTNVSSFAMPEKLRSVDLFGIAPREYWAEASRKWVSTAKLKNAFANLSNRIQLAGFPMRFGQFSATPIDKDPYFDVGSVEDVGAWFKNA